ncbi:MAG: TrbC/VirB2 family protein, partial [Patescibacteria group bacterium]
TNPIAAGTFLELLTSILKVLVEIGTPILVIAIVWVGFLFISARGNPTKLTTAKDAFFYTLIGAAVVIGAKAIAEVITNTVGNL